MVKARLESTLAAVLLALGIGAVTMDGAGAQSSGASNTTASAAPIRQSLPPQVLSAKPAKIRKNYWLAYQLASYEWLDKVAEADPSIIAAICSHSGPAKVLAGHHHLDKIADIDHYVCRRICRWRRAAEVLVRSPYADIVIDKDPQGFVMAMDQHPGFARLIAGHRQFNELIYNDPDMGREIAKHIR